MPFQIEFSDEDYQCVEFNNQIHSRIKICPMYYNLGFSPVPAIFGRLIVIKKLLKAINLLPKEYGFLIWDVYRPREVQGRLFDWMRAEVKKKKPDLDDQENYHETKKYMSAPSKIGDTYCPPHLSGGAIDLTLYRIADDLELDMGTAFDDCSARAHRDYFKFQMNLSEEDKLIQERRNLLRRLMETVGFTSYHYEWWHFDIGNIFWSREMRLPEVFGPLFGDKEWQEFEKLEVK